MRTARPTDLEALARLEHEVFGEEAWSIASLRGLLREDDDGHLALIYADEAEAPLTAYAAFRAVLDEAELLRVAVHPSARRRGLARRLLLHGLTSLATRGVGSCHLEVRADNEAARALYAELGFERVGLRRGYYAGRGSETHGTSAAARVDAELWTWRAGPVGGHAGASENLEPPRSRC